MPVKPDEFYGLMPTMEKLFGKPASLHLNPLNRVRYVTTVDGKHIDIFLMHEESKSWTDGVKFGNYLLKHPEALEAYRILKERGVGLTTREYYHRKVEFINEIVAKAEAEERT